MRIPHAHYEWNHDRLVEKPAMALLLLKSPLRSRGRPPMTAQAAGAWPFAMVGPPL